MYAICIKENKDRPYFRLGEKYLIINADRFEYATGTYENQIWFSKNDIEHFKFYI